MMHSKIISFLSIHILFIESIICLSTSKHVNNGNDNDETTRIPTSCVGLEDGYHYIKLLQDDIENSIQFPILHIVCHNEYIILIIQLIQNGINISQHGLNIIMVLLVQYVMINQIGPNGFYPIDLHKYFLLKMIPQSLVIILYRQNVINVTVIQIFNYMDYKHHIICQH